MVFNLYIDIEETLLNNEIFMKTIRVLSLILLAAYLILQGFYYIAEMTTPIIHAAIGLLGLGAGTLMFISLGHWVNLKKEK